MLNTIRVVFGEGINYNEIAFIDEASFGQGLERRKM